MIAERQSTLDLGKDLRNPRFFIRGSVPSVKRYENVKLYPDRRIEPYGCGHRLQEGDGWRNYSNASKTDWYYYRDMWWKGLSGAARPLRIHFRFVRRDNRPFKINYVLNCVMENMWKRDWILSMDDCDIIPVIENKRIDKDQPGVELWLDDDNG